MARSRRSPARSWRPLLAAAIARLRRIPAATRSSPARSARLQRFLPHGLRLGEAGTAELQVALTGQSACQDHVVAGLGRKPACFRKSRLGFGEVAAQQQEVPQGNECPPSQSRVAGAGQVQRSAEPLASLRPVSVRGPERRHRGTDPKRDGAVPGRNSRIDGTPNIVLVGDQVAHDLRSTAAAYLGLDTLDPKREPGSMPSGQLIVLAERVSARWPPAARTDSSIDQRSGSSACGTSSEARARWRRIRANVASRTGQAGAHFGDCLGGRRHLRTWRAERRGGARRLGAGRGSTPTRREASGGEAVRSAVRGSARRSDRQAR